MTAAKTATKKPAAKKPAPAKAVQKPAVKKVEKAEAKPAQPKKEKPEGEKKVTEGASKKVNKMATAIIVFEKMTKAGKARKDIIAAFQSEVGLTKAGSATYYQSIKNME